MKSIDKYPYLVIEKRHNDFIFLDISSLDIFNVFDKEKLNYQSLDMLDSLTLQFRSDDIKQSILRANVVANSEDVYNGRLFIKLNKHKLPVMTNEIVSELNMPKFFNEIFDIRPNENKKRYLNIIYNKLTSIVKDNQLLINLKESIDAVDNNRFYSLFAHLSYLEQRELYFYIYQDVLPKYNNILKRKKESNNE